MPISPDLRSFDIRPPRDYFHGLSSRNLCQLDNLLLFLRLEKKDLQRRTFDSRPHHRWVLILCFETEGSINVDGRIFHLRPGDAFLVKPYQFHFYMEIASEQITWLFLTFETPRSAPFDTFANTPIPTTREQQEQILEIAREYGNAENANEVSRDLLILSATCLLNSIRALALGTARSLIPSPKYQNTGYELVDRINSLLESSLDEYLSIERLARSLSVSESHLRKLFRKLTGVSLGKYLVHYKLNRAVKLLVHSSASLTQIASECGYESLAAFSRSFKKELGASPSRYRKNANLGQLGFGPPKLTGPLPRN